jgi:hypothetical protein
MLAAGWDPVAIDAYGCDLLDRSWQDVNHIVYADGELGDARYTLYTV